ncbi:MAG TPA: carboxypeptidase-like regulatory domain-containing protein [Burkholderiales bacterium]|nr:carboxypeptidase-like regulatory domain-containing protein [Burkholderiales bacterium]
MRTLLLVVGSAIGGIVLFVVAVWGYFVHRINAGGDLPSMSISNREQASEVVSVPPPIRERFLGSSGSSRGFPVDRSKVLATGPGTIAGRVTAAGTPVPGLRVRLALNGSVMSGWTETDASGRYAVRVPYGKYRVDGYELDYKILDELLGGMTDSPQNEPGSDDVMTVAEGKPGRGVDLDYVAPVRITSPAGEVSLAKPVVIEWEAYPGAAQYEIQLTEAREARDYTSRRQLFPCCSIPRASGTSFNLAERRVVLKRGHVYYVDVTALDSRGKRVASSGGRQARPNFSIAD